MSGKGSKPRPLSISHKEYRERWDQIFSKKDKEKHETQMEEIESIKDESNDTKENQ